MTMMLLKSFQSIAFQCILSTANHITPTSRMPVKKRQRKNLTSSGTKTENERDLLPKTQILFVTNANSTAKNHASIVDETFGIFNAKKKSL